jgi:replicative DNA helicase
LLGCIIRDHDSLEEINIKPDDLYHPKHQKIFEVIEKMRLKLIPVDIITLANELPDLTTDIARLSSLMPTSANIKQYAEIVIEKSRLRQLQKAGNKIQSLANEDFDKVDELINQAEKIVYDLSANRTSNDIVPARIALNEYSQMVDEAAKKGSNIVGLDTGFTDINYMTSGFQKQDLIILGARPSMGKTALMLNIATNVSAINKLPVAVFSLEMSRRKLAMRMIASLAKIDTRKLKLLNLNEYDSKNYTKAYEMIEKAPLYIDDTPAISAMEILSKSRRIKRKHGLELVVIDYLGLMAGHKGVGRYESVSENVRILKNIARELDCPVLCLSQLSRSVEQRDNKRPMLSDLRETGEVEQTADVVFFLYREEYYKPSTDKRNIAELIIAKQRDDATGTVELGWLKEYTKFLTLDRRPGQ